MPTIITRGAVSAKAYGFGVSGGYSVGKSLRFRSSASAYLNRTFGAGGSLTTWTWSAWVKRGTLGSNTQQLFGWWNYGSGGSSNTQHWMVITNDTIEFKLYSGASNTYYCDLVTTQVFRDPSAWYHIVFVWDTTNATTSNRARIYVNGAQVTAFTTATYPSQNTNGYINNTSPTASHFMGAVVDANYSSGTPLNPFDGYMAEVNFVNGQALTPSSFGTYDSNGVWQPIKYSGTYGTNGFYLNFGNTTSTTTLGYDTSGNGNNWTTNNISLTAGATYDSMTDSPTVTSSSVANYAVWNYVDKSSSTTLSFANLLYGSQSAGSAGNGNSFGVRSSIGVSSGKWYAEFTKAFSDTNSQIIGVGTGDIVLGTYNSYINNTTGGNALPNSTSIHGGVDQSGNVGIKIGSSTTYTTPGTSFTTNDILSYALDCDNKTLKVYKNNVQIGNTLSWSGTTPYGNLLYFFSSQSSTWNYPGWYANFGQQPFTYTPPTGFNALNTYNLPTPTITNGAQYMAATLYTGNGSTLAINTGTNTTIGTTFQTDLAWIKSRSAATSHSLMDVLRGYTGPQSSYPRLSSDLTNAEVNNGGISAFTSTGFNLNADAGITNTNGATYVAWSWKANGAGVTNTNGSITSTVSANTTAGFSVVTYTGTGAAATVGHGLGVAPSFIILKSRSVADVWPCYHASIGNLSAILLNSTNAITTNILYFNNTSPTSSVFSLGGGAAVNTNGSTNVAYCWAAVAGYSAFGSYTGNGSTDGPFVYCGFRPRWIMIKNSSSSGDDWILFDSSRNTYNVTDLNVRPNTSGAEGSQSANYLDLLSNGFKIRGTSAGTINASQTYIYAAFAESPFQISRAR